jgi:hypothetical protein
LEFLEFDLAGLLVEGALGVVHEDHGEHEESGLTDHEFVGLDQEALELIHVWLPQIQSLLEELLPLPRQLSLDQVGQGEELVVLGALDLKERHLGLGQVFVVNLEDEGSLGLLELLNELKVHEVVRLHVFHLHLVLALDLINPLLGQVIFIAIVSHILNQKLILLVLLGLQEEDVEGVPGEQDLGVLSALQSLNGVDSRLGGRALGLIAHGIGLARDGIVGHGLDDFALVELGRDNDLDLVLGSPVEEIFLIDS